jgi:photosynthetic reaction center cytochrome c subunit
MKKPRLILLLVFLIGTAAFVTYQRSQTEQRGYRGTAMIQLQRPATIAAKEEINKYPKPLPKAKTDGPTALESYENIQVLGDLSKSQVARLMLSFKAWVAPEEGCGYCHAAPNYASDEKYPKLVAREMIRMVRRINTEWTPHVGTTGVVCWTCHRGKPVPAKIWFNSPEREPNGMAESLRVDYRQPMPSAWSTTLPAEAMTDYLLRSEPIRIVGTTALQEGNRHSVNQAKETYSLMLVMADSLGVNCTFCHNTRAFASWDLSPPQRATAWYGIRMVRDLNNTHLARVATLLPPNRMGPAGDGPKLYCATCHRGSQKPLNGFKLIESYPELRPVVTPPADQPTLTTAALSEPGR